MKLILSRLGFQGGPYCFALLGLLTVLGTAACAGRSPAAATYGTKVRFTKNTPVAFPEFDLIYTGRRHITSPVYKRGFDYDDFKVGRGAKSITVSWSGGTGLLGPQEFEFGSQKFSLELRHDDKLGWLKEDEVVVRKK